MSQVCRRTLVSVLSLLWLSAVFSQANAESAVEEGRKIAQDRKKGNCMACHTMGDARLPGNVGPPLVAIKARFPEKAKLRAQIWDPTVKNPQSMMPPFGKHGILSADELEKVVEYVYTL